MGQNYSYLFGAGTIIAKRVGVVNPLPAFVGTIQQFEFDIDQTIKMLYGAYKFPVAIGAGEGKVTAKCKFARVQANIMNDLLIGGTYTPSSGTDLSVAEQWTLPGTTANSVTVSNAASFVEDWGVFYNSGAGAGEQLQPGTSVSAGTYAVTSGTYSFDAADGGSALLIYYDYTTTLLNSILFDNQLMGQQPTFKLIAKESFLFRNVQREMVLILNNCTAGKLTFPFKNNDFMVSDMDIDAFADESNNIGTIGLL